MKKLLLVLWVLAGVGAFKLFSLPWWGWLIYAVILLALIGAVAPDKEENAKSKDGMEEKWEDEGKPGEKSDAAEGSGSGEEEDSEEEDSEEEEEVIRKCREAAEAGDAEAQYNLGLCYEKGEGVEKDMAEAVKWYRKAAEQGNVKAQYNLGLCYHNGAGVEKDLAEAVKWCRAAAEQGHTGAQYNLGWSYANGEGVEKDLVEAVKWYRKAAEQGHASAQNNLGVRYRDGEGVEKDLAEAVKWYRAAAEQGYATAQCNLGWCYKNGEGVEKDLAEAVKWYRKAAEQGHASAQNNLGVMYRDGEGVKKDLAEAVKWFRKAAEQGNTRAQNNLDACYKTGWFADKDDDGKRYEIVMERVTGDVDRLNSFYNKNLRYIDPYRFPEIDDVAGRGKFPQTPLVLFDNLKKSQADLLLNLLGNNYTVRESTTVYPDEITINLGSLFSPAILTFVKVTGLVNRGVAEDFWIATTPVTKSMMAWAKKKLGEDYSESDLKNNDWQGSDYKLFSQCLETFWREQRPLGFRFGILDKSEFEYALKGGQYGSSYKHPGTDSAEEFKKGKTVNALGMGYLNDLHQCWIDEKNDVKGCVYSTQTRQLEEKKSEYWGLIWCGIHVHRGMMKAALKKREEQKKAQKQERKAQQAEQKAQQVVDAAVLRRQKLMEKRKEGK